MVIEPIFQNSSSLLFAYFSTRLVSWYDGGFHKIYQHFFLKSFFVNNCILKKTMHPRYTKLDNIGQKVIAARRHFVIIKCDINDAFFNVLFDVVNRMALWIWLESLLLNRKLFIFCAFNIASYLQFVCKSFPLDPSVFFELGFRALFEQFCGTSACNWNYSRKKSNEKQWLCLFHRPFEIAWHVTKNLEETVVFIFSIEVDINLFIEPFSPDKIYKISNLATITLNKRSMTLLKAKTLTSSLPFWDKVMLIG